MIRHYFNFISSNHGLREIDEPSGFRSADFVIEQESGRKGRDVAYAAGKQLRIYERLDQCFDIFKYNRDVYGTEAIIKYCISFTDNEIINIGQVLVTSTDRKTYYEFVAIEESERMIFKRRMELNTNLFSDKTLDDKDIEKVGYDFVLVKAKPIFQVSEWDWPGQKLVKDWPGYGRDFAIIAPFPNLKQYDIGDSYGTFGNYFETSVPATSSQLERIREETTVIKAKTNLRNVKISLRGVNLSVANVGASVITRITVGFGSGYAAGSFDFHDVFSSSSSNINLVNQNYDFEIPFLNNTNFIFLQVTIAQPFSVPATTPVSNTHIEFSAGTMTISATEVAYNTVVPMVRLIDAMRYNVLSSAALSIRAPRWEYGGELHDQFITTQALMRNLFDKPFNISTKDIVDNYLPEVNGDYQLQEDGTVFFGATDEYQDDFYKNYQIADFTQGELTQEFGQTIGQLEGFEELDNEKTTINQFNFGYNTYASQKENVQENTYDDVHGETQSIIRNKNSENKKDVKVGLVRSAFSWEEARRKAYLVSDSSATQDDDKIFISDVTTLPPGTRFTETASLQHRFIDSYLLLVNDKSFNWQLLGLGFSGIFTINTGPNAGNYIIADISATELKLISTGVLPIDILIENTTFTYYIRPDIVLTNRTNEGFGVILNLQDGSEYPNLRFTCKRNIVKRYGSYLASCAINAENKEIKNTLYKNNPEATTSYLNEGLIIEGDPFTATGPILTHSVIKLKLLMTLQQFFDLRAKVRSENGYIKTFDSNGLPLNGYIQKASWTFLNNGALLPDSFIGVMETTIEEKYEVFFMYIFSDNNVIIINNEISPSNFDFEIDGLGNLRIFDETGKLLQGPVPYNKVQVNNSQPATSVEELAQWLNILRD